MSTEVELYRPGAVAVTERDVVDGWITVLGDVARLSDQIADTDFVPRVLRNKPAAIAACILTGRELGIGPMASLKSIHMVQGTPSLSAEYKRARALEAGHQIAIDESNSTRCIVRGRRANSDKWVTITWTMDMARRAKLAGKDVWQQYPQRMLQARATSELCDLLFPDATLGLETTEVLEDGGALAVALGAAEETSEPETKPEPPKPRTAQRRTGTPAAEVTQPSEPPSEKSPSQVPPPQASNLPPLPGEDETDYDTPGTVTRPQLTKIAILWQELGFSDDQKADRLKHSGRIVGRDLGSSKDLSRNEAGTLIETIERCGTDWDKLSALLDAGDNPEGGE